MKTLAEKMKEQQASPEYTESWEDFSGELSVEVAMGKNMEKRPGTERGEDMFLADKETGLTGVFDGLGGEGKKGSGADASGSAALFTPSLYKILRKKAESGPLDAALSEVAKAQASLKHPSDAAAFGAGLEKDWSRKDPAIQKEIVSLFETVRKLSDKVRESGGKTTATLGKTVTLADGRMFEIIANVGDSGATRIDAEGNAEDVTEEDSAVDYLLSHGVITKEQAADPNFEVQPGKSIKKLRTAMYQALGTADMPVVPRISVVELKPGDKMVYATDGIRDEISDATGSFDAQRAADLMSNGAEGLMKAAAKGPKKDERTMLVKERVHTLETLNEEEEPIEELGEEDIEELREAK